MSFKLQINQLSDDGEIVRSISCLSGRITVFRSISEDTYRAYADALSGTLSEERFSIILDGKKYDPDKSILIGFKEAFEPEQKISVEEYLTLNNSNISVSESLLLEIGLGGLSKTSVTDLSPSQQRVLRLIKASLSKNIAIIAYEPFDIVPEKWQDKMGEILINAASSQNLVVVIVKLSNRPESWIENEYISKVQLEKPRRRTIGFGSASVEASNAELIKKVRTDLKSVTHLTDGAKPPHTPISLTVIISTATLTALIVAFVLYLANSQNVNSNTQAIVAGKIETKTEQKIVSNEPEKIRENNQPESSIENRIVPSLPLVQKYSLEIREGVALSFNDPIRALSHFRPTPETQAKKPSGAKNVDFDEPNLDMEPKLARFIEVLEQSRRR